MKRILICVIAALATAGAAIAANWTVRDIDIRVRLMRDGSAVVQEKWDMDASDGTEFYIPRENLGDIVISRFRVSEGSKAFDFSERWDTGGSLDDKAGKCGFNRTDRGVELCWGLGSYGGHVFDISYEMTNTVKSLNDFDMFHLQLVNSRMASSPKHVKVTIECPGRQIDTSWVRMWGFGFEGTTAFGSDGSVVLESSEPFSYYSSVIALLRFEKGYFESESVQDRDFQVVLDKAMQGADFGKEEEDMSFLETLLSMVFTMAIICFFVVLPLKQMVQGGKLSKRQKRKLLGADPDEVDWYRDIPFEGDIRKADFVLEKLEDKRQSNAVASAIILRLIQQGYLSVRTAEKGKGKVDIYFNDSADLQKLDEASRDLYNMMKEASGEDQILQDREFSRWSSKQRNKTRIRDWAVSMQSVAKRDLSDSLMYKGGKFTPEGQTEAQHLFGLKRYLKDYTIMGERHSAEVTLWQDYMVFASLFGIADRVAKELKDIDPQVFEQVVPYDYTTYVDVIRMTNSLARSITNARYVPPAPSPVSSKNGMGGFSSFGGGGGFSGGGFGGGVR